MKLIELAVKISTKRPRSLKLSEFNDMVRSCTDYETYRVREAKGIEKLLEKFGHITTSFSTFDEPGVMVSYFNKAKKLNGGVNTGMSCNWVASTPETDGYFDYENDTITFLYGIKTLELKPLVETF